MTKPNTEDISMIYHLWFYLKMGGYEEKLDQLEPLDECAIMHTQTNIVCITCRNQYIIWMQ